MRRRINTAPDEKRAQDHPNLDRAAVSIVTRVSIRNMDSLGSEPHAVTRTTGLLAQVTWRVLGEKAGLPEATWNLRDS